MRLLLLPVHLRDQLLAQLLGELPNEGGGILAGISNAEGCLVKAVLPLPNVLQSPLAYLSEGSATIQANRTMREHGWEVVGVYHSHPTSRPIPSKRDQEEIYDQNVMTVIVGMGCDPPEIEGWWIRRESFSPSVLKIVEDLQN
jgi:[CysO sulfur-carrier protein]-S-L-cysteine hydrolase